MAVFPRLSFAVTVTLCAAPAVVGEVNPETANWLAVTLKVLLAGLAVSGDAVAVSV